MLTITVQPDTEPVTPDEAKHQLRIMDGEAYEGDDWLMDRIKGCREEAESLQGRSYITREYVLIVEAASTIELLMPPLQAVSEVLSIDEDGVETEITDYTINTTLPVPALTIADLPTDSVYIKVTYTAGYGDTPADVPLPTRQAILVRLTQYYNNREGLKPEHDSFFERLLGKDRLNWGF